MNKKDEIKAHDILADDNFSIELLSDKSEDKGKTNEREIQIARLIYTYFSSRKSTSWEKEKEQTKKRLESSIQGTNYRNRFIIRRWAVAASFLLIVFSAWFFYTNVKERREISEFTQNLDNVQPDSVTNLFLNNGRKVLIAEKESQIAYDKKGENIVIDSTQKVSQQVVPEKQVFNTLVVPYGKRTQITLSDGSKVWLNSGSKLVYPANLKEKRKVYIEGEAVFEVTHSEQHPFYVVTKDFEIKVLGTVFNVNAYPDEKMSNTVLQKGKIEIASTDNSLFNKEKLTILPGTMAVFNQDERKFYQNKVDADNYLSWRDGYFIFKNEPLENILKKIERYYNVHIELDDIDLGKEKFSGNLDLKDTPDDILKVIAETTPILVRYEDDKLIINLK